MDWDLVPETRVHPIDFASARGSKVYLKREDETGFAITGGKQRKYASILPWLRDEEIEQVGLIGSANSNHLVSAAQLLLAAGIQAIPISKQNWTKGSNQDLLALLVDKTEWLEIEGAAWQDVEHFAASWAKRQTLSGRKTIFLPEGAFVPAALPGAMTLAGAILKDQAQLETNFQHIFIDAGTCLSAIGLAFGLAEAEYKGKMYVVSMAEDAHGFWMRWNRAIDWLPAREQAQANAFKNQIVLHRPVSGPRFGSKNQTVMDAIQRYARNFGLLTDPIYSAKLLMTAEAIIPLLPENEHVLIVHGGGAQSLLGFIDSK